LSKTLGSALVKKNRLLDARQIFLEAYDRSFELGDHEYNEYDLKDIRELAWKYSELQDFPSAKSLLQQALKVAEAKGEKGTRAKSDVYLALAQLNLARKRPAEAAAIFKNYELAVKEMKVDVQRSTMQNGMREYARLLEAYGYHDQSSEMTARAELAEKAETEKRATARAKIPATTSPSFVLTNLAPIPDSQLHSDPR
jgi:tetratricopeptide (TPR) repeat protein